MSSLPNQLNQIKGIKHALYADDLTIWTTGGSTGTQQDQLQEAVRTTEQYLTTCGLSCAPEKSELLILRRRTRGRRPQEIPDPEVTLGGISITKVSTLRILGLLIQKDGTGGAELEKLQRTVQQITHLIKRVASKRHGLKEEDCIAMIQALLTSTITYGTPYVDMKNGQRQKVNILIRKAYKIAMGLSPTTSTMKLLQMGVHNTWEELIEAQRVNQLERLKLTKTGQALLKNLGYTVEKAAHLPQCIPQEIKDKIFVCPLPRNMHPEHDKGRRQA